MHEIMFDIFISGDALHGHWPSALISVWLQLGNSENASGAQFADADKFVVLYVVRPTGNFREV
jgi:hypothetical protein